MGTRLVGEKSKECLWEISRHPPCAHFRGLRSDLVCICDQSPSDLVYMFGGEGARPVATWSMTIVACVLDGKRFFEKSVFIKFVSAQNLFISEARPATPYC
jgi:hypothetical protein